MLEVIVKVNGHTIGEAIAINRGRPHLDPDANDDPDDRLYEAKDGGYIIHNREAGAAALAKRLLDRMDLEDEP